MQIGSSLQVLRSVNPHLSTPVEVTHQRTHCKLIFHHDFMQNIKAWQKAKNSKLQTLQLPLRRRRNLFWMCPFIFSDLWQVAHIFLCLLVYQSIDLQISFWTFSWEKELYVGCTVMPKYLKLSFTMATKSLWSKSKNSPHHACQFKFKYFYAMDAEHKKIGKSS